MRQGNGAVVVFGHKSVDMIVSMLACLFAKRIYVPVGNFTPIDRIQKTVGLSNAQSVIANEPVDLNDVECLNINTLSEKYFVGDFENNDNNIAYVIFTSGSTGEPRACQYLMIIWLILLIGLVILMC